MDEPTKKEKLEPLTEAEIMEAVEAGLLTEAEINAVKEAAQKQLAGWAKSLSPEEFETWYDASQEDCAAQYDKWAQYLADIKAVMRFAGHEDPFVAMNILRNKEHRTLAEAEALDCFDRAWFSQPPLRFRS